MTVAELKREVLVRHLEAWAPTALHHRRRAIYVHGYADADGGAAAEAAMQVFAEQSDLVRGRELTVLLLGDDVSAPATGSAPGLMVHALSGGTDDRLEVALKAAGAVRVPLLGFLDASAATAPPASVAAPGTPRTASNAYAVCQPLKSAARNLTCPASRVVSR